MLGEMLHKKAGAALRGSMGSIWLCTWQAVTVVVAVPVPVMVMDVVPVAVMVVVIVPLPVAVMVAVVVTVTVRVVAAHTTPAGAAPMTSPGQVPGRWAQRGQRRWILPSSATRGVQALCAGCWLTPHQGQAGTLHKGIALLIRALSHRRLPGAVLATLPACYSEVLEYAKICWKLSPAVITSSALSPPICICFPSCNFNQFYYLLLISYYLILIANTVAPFQSYIYINEN